MPGFVSSRDMCNFINVIFGLEIIVFLIRPVCIIDYSQAHEKGIFSKYYKS